MKRKLAFFIVAVVACTVCLVGKHLASSNEATASAADLRGTSAQVSTKTSAAAPDSLPTVTDDMNSAIAGYPDLDTAATLIDLDTGRQYTAGQTTTLFKAASTAKVLTAIDYLHQTETGQATLSQSIDGTSAEQLIKQMIEVSDDQAWADLNNYLGDQQQTYADSIGLSSFTGGEYYTMTAADEAKLLALLYQGKLINAADRNLLYTYMANTTNTNLIQAALPSDATVYHKYGQLWGYLNDAAIVDYQGHHFALVIFTNNPAGTSDDYNDQVALIHAVTAAVFKDIN
ncbi:MAG TPA: serine hydrolase [Candidatus Saccharimonadales bacterium]|nr:serine hydrolase [Candidatus Saccharimonadales bacterium]